MCLGKRRHKITANDTPLEQEEISNGVVHPVTKEIITKNKQVIDDPVVREVRMRAMCKELVR